MNTQYTTQEILQSSIQNINTLKDHLDKIDELRIDIKNTVEEAEKLPEEFNKIVVKIDQTTNKFVQKNQELLKEQIVYFQEKLIDLTMRINQIDEVDFSKKFEIAKNDFFENVKDSTSQLDNLIIKIETGFTDSKKEFFSELLKSVDELDSKIKEIKAIDLEAHFNKHDKSLSDIFTSINNISNSLVSFSNQLSNFLNKINEIDNKINQLEIKLNNLDLKFDKIEQQIENENKVLNDKIELLTKKNQTSHTINLVLIVVAIIAIIAMKYI